METFQEEFLCHYGVKGMKWGHRKQRVSIGRDRRQLRKQFRKEYRIKKLSGKSTTIGKGPHRMDLNKTGYANYKAEQAVRKKHGNKAVNAYDKNKSKKEWKAIGALGAAAVGTLGGTMLYAAAKSKGINAKKLGDNLNKAIFNSGVAVGKAAGTVKSIQNDPIYRRALKNQAKNTIKRAVGR